MGKMYFGPKDDNITVKLDEGNSASGTIALTTDIQPELIPQAMTVPMQPEIQIIKETIIEKHFDHSDDIKDLKEGYRANKDDIEELLKQIKSQEKPFSEDEIKSIVQISEEKLSAQLDQWKERLAIVENEQIKLANKPEPVIPKVEPIKESKFKMLLPILYALAGALLSKLL